MIMNIYYIDILYLIPELYTCYTIIIMIIYSIFISNKYTLLNNKKYNISINVIKILINNIIYILIILIILYYLNLNNFRILFTGEFVINYYTQIIKIIIIIITIICFLTFTSYTNNTKINDYEYIILIFIALFSICILLNSNDLLHYYIIIELQSLCFYIITASKKFNIYSSEAGIKYFILGSFIAGILLTSISLIYGITGLTNLKDISIYLLTNKTYENILIFSFILFYSTLLFKLTIAPFHIWAADVYEGAPSIVTLYFNTAPKFAIIIILIKFLIVVFYSLINIWQILLILNIILTLVIATFNALKQAKFKRFLIFSSITHVGYILLGLATGSIEGIQSIIIYLIIYIISIINIWSIYIYFNNQITYITDLHLVYQHNKALGLSLIISLLSMAGIPPMAGFLAKFYSFFVCIENNLIIISIIGIILSIITCFYYIRNLKLYYFDTKKKIKYYKLINNNFCKIIAIIISITGILLILIFICPSPIFIITHKIALSICL